MSGITINGKQYVDTKGNDQDWQLSELTKASGANAAPAHYEIFSMVSLAELMNAAGFAQGTTWSLEQLLTHAGDVPPLLSEDAEELQTQITEATKKLETLDNASSQLKINLSTVKQEIEALLKGRTEKDLSPTEIKTLNDLKEKQALLESAKEHTEKVLTQLLSKLKDSALKAEQDNEGLEEGTYKDKSGAEQKFNANQMNTLRNAFQALKARLGIGDAKQQDTLGQKQGELKAKKNGGGTGDAEGAEGSGGARGGGRAAMGGGPFGQARAGGAGFPPLDMNAMLMSNYMQQNQLEGMDAVHKTENESKRMMLLFFMLARMAMSGDVGAMYQFLRFIGHIVNKDKAMQNVQLARKLIELQDVSRKLTQMLVDAPSYDEEDQGVQAEYMKLQQKVQAEQGVIATSQKLIAQMLEEFTQVSEMMTGMVKSLLDARGREMSMLAVWRA